MLPDRSHKGVIGNPLLCSMSPCWKNSSIILLLHFLCSSNPLAPCPISHFFLILEEGEIVPAHFKAADKQSRRLDSSPMLISLKARALLNLFMMMKCFWRSVSRIICTEHFRNCRHSFSLRFFVMSEVSLNSGFMNNY